MIDIPSSPVQFSFLAGAFQKAASSGPIIRMLEIPSLAVLKTSPEALDIENYGNWFLIIHLA